MTDAPSPSPSEFEFSETQNQLIGSLARKMAVVGFVMTFFGLLQIFNGLASLFLVRDPDRVIAAAKQAGVSEEQLSTLRESLAGGFWSSPVTASAIGFSVGGLFLFLIGLWTRQAGVGFAGIVVTKGKDISRLMEALGALHRKYGLIYSVLLAAALISLVSLVYTLWHSWRGA